MAERKLDYESLHFRSDLGFRVKAPSLERLFIDSARAMTDLLVKLDLIAEKDKKMVKIQADSQLDLLAYWLNEVMSVIQNQKFLPKRIVFYHFDGKKIEAALFGESYEPVRHGHVVTPKPITNKQLEMGPLNEPPNNFYARLLV